MGLFSKLRNAIGGILDKVGKVFNSEKISKTAANLQNRTSATAQIIGTSKAYKASTTSITEINRVNNSLADYAYAVKQDMKSIESVFLQVIDDFSVVMLDVIENNVIEIQFKNKCQQEKDSIKDSLAQIISQRMSSSDTECLSIMKMRPSAEKERAMQLYSKKIQKEAIKKVREQLTKSLKRINEWLRREVYACYDEAIVNSTHEIELLKDIQENIREKNSVIEEINKVINVANQVLEVISKSNDKCKATTDILFNNVGNGL